jgi:hypothetical protein
MKQYNVLIVPGGTEIGLEIFKALHFCREVKLFSAGGNVSSHASFVYARHFNVPNIHDPIWIPSINRIIVDNSIDYVFPGYDDMIVALALNQDAIKARIVTSPTETCLITRSKKSTYCYLQNDIPTPLLYPDPESIIDYPVFVKPDKGHGSMNTYLVTNKKDLYIMLKANKELITTEHLPGEEYTVDCFSDRETGLLFCSGRIRIKTKNGISMHSKIADDQQLFLDYARIISSRLPLHGAWFFQVKRDRKGVLKLLEIAPRIASTAALQRVHGINFPLLSIYEQERRPISFAINDMYIEINRALVNRYRHNLVFSNVYISLDDTLVVGDKINVDLISFLFQCHQNGNRLILLANGNNDVRLQLRKHRILALFDDIIRTANDLDKINHINNADSILIDNNINVRNEVNSKLSICTFDCSMVEMLVEGKLLL